MKKDNIPPIIIVPGRGLTVAEKEEFYQFLIDLTAGKYREREASSKQSEKIPLIPNRF